MRDAAGVPLYKVSYPTSVSRTEPIPGDNPHGAPNTFMGSYTVYVRNDTAECRMGKYVSRRSCGEWQPDGGGAIRGNRLRQQDRGGARDRHGTEGRGRTTSTSGAGGVSQVLCNSGKNACDDNNSVINNVVVN